MMKWFILLGWIISNPVFAQQISVRSGAHEGFTRLVLDAPEGTAWKSEPLSTGARLVLNGHTGGFDISAVFDRIDRTFVSEVTANDSSISVEFSCQCIANTFAAGTRMIVLDIKLKPEKENIEIRNLPLTSSMKNQWQSIEFLQTIEISEPLEKQTEYFGGLGFRPKSMRPQLLSPTLVQNLKTDVNQYQNFQTSLSKQIGAAATQGLLTPSFSEVELTQLPPSSQINYRTFFSPLTDKHQISSATPTLDNIEVTNSSEARKKIVGSINMQAPIGGPCIDSELVAVQDWQPEIDFSTDVGMLRSKLFREFDKLDRRAAIMLAQLYLHYGFGAEARQILYLDDSLVKANPSLIVIAEIMEYGHSRRPTYLENFVDCDGPVALWSILSTPEIDPVKAINVDAALLNLSGLPMHLRKVVAPDLSRRFLNYGDKDAAAAALHSLERSPVPLSPNAIFAKASLQLAQGEVDEGRRRLSEVIASNAEQSAEALIEFVTSHLNANDEIGHDVALLIDAYAQELRDSPIGEQLAHTHVLALGQSGQFPEAFTSLSNLRSRHKETGEDPLLSAILDILIRDAADHEFLKYAFLHIASAPEILSVETRIHAAERLVALGFYEQGEYLLSINPTYPKNTRTSLLKAEISIELSRPHEALAHLFGETSKRAQFLRARAKSSLGDFSQAYSIYSNIGDEMNSQRTAWLANNWGALIQDEVPIFGAAARISQVALDTSTELDGILERSALAISESQGARQAIEDLLNTNPSLIIDN
ncbi:tetratricopeptide repeat protein [Tateyamaria sp.]|uniref:tetratricopeptide repeat protein n=1 Tax=Tateyamaria sp. TaxID=1929288 RepID=UPI00329F93D3